MEDYNPSGNSLGNEFSYSDFSAGLSSYDPASHFVPALRGLPMSYKEVDGAEYSWNSDGSMYRNGEQPVASITLATAWSEYDSDVRLGQYGWFTRAEVGVLRVFFPPSDPIQIIVTAEGNRYRVLGGGPSTGAMLGQVFSYGGIAYAAGKGILAAGWEFGKQAAETAAQEISGLPLPFRMICGKFGKAPGATQAPGRYLTADAPKQVSTPGTRVLQGQHVNDLGRVEPWTAHYDEYGRLIGRTDFNAGNRAAGIPDTHFHTYEWGRGKNPLETGKHLPGEFQQ